MNILRIALIVFLLSSTTVMAAPASENSIKQLLSVTKAQKLVDGMRLQIEAAMNNAIQQALNGQSPTPKQQQAVNNMKDGMISLIQGELAWEKLEPMYLRLYKESFTEEEVAGMLSFYKTPAGKALINKMPTLMQKTLMEIQRMSSELAPRMQLIQQKFFTEMKEAAN